MKGDSGVINGFRGSENNVGETQDLGRKETLENWPDIKKSTYLGKGRGGQ